MNTKQLLNEHLVDHLAEYDAADTDKCSQGRDG
jgi:hypothetical protein